MCDIIGGLFGGGGGSDAAEQQARAEAERAARVREGTEKINQQFARFGPDFFQGIEQSALDFFKPQVQEQYEDTREGLVKNLFRSGNIRGSAGARQLGDLNEALSKGQAQVADKARSISQGARADIEGQRANLIQNLAATADPFAASQAAAASAEALSRPPEYSPIGDMFAKFANLAAPQITAARAGFQNPASRFFPSNGSYSVVA